MYSISIWNVSLEQATQSNLVITPDDQPQTQVDNLHVAQFIYLLLNRQELRKRDYYPWRKGGLDPWALRWTWELLDSMADNLRSLGYLSMIFDFDRPTDRDLTETVKILAGLSRFVIADITNPRLLELQATVPDYMVRLLPSCSEVSQPSACSMFFTQIPLGAPAAEYTPARRCLPTSSREW